MSHLKPASPAPFSRSVESWSDPGAAGSVLGRSQRPLYGEFYGLKEAPFDLTPNPRFLFLSRHQREVLSNLRYALTGAKGFTVILGDAGTGKTTLVRTALGELHDTRNRHLLISNPALTRGEFYEMLAQGFGLSEEAGRSKSRFLAEFQADIEARLEAGGLTALIIDEGQSLPYELLEEIRLLGNFETATTKLLNIVLCGQPELGDRLNDPSLRQLKQRLALRCELKPLTLEETAAYLSGRLRIAGASPGDVFTRETVVAINRASSGIPRTINVLAENALIGGFAANLKPVPVGIVDEVCRDFQLRPSETQASETTTAVAPASSALGRPRADQAPQKTGERALFESVNAPKRRFSFFR